MQKLCFYDKFGTELDEFGTESAQFGTEFKRMVYLLYLQAIGKKGDKGLSFDSTKVLIFFETTKKLG